MSEILEQAMTEFTNIAERYSSGFDLRKYGLSEEQMFEIAVLFSDRVKFIAEEAIKAYLGTLWHNAEKEPPQTDKPLLITNGEASYICNIASGQKYDLKGYDYIYIEDLNHKSYSNETDKEP